LIASGALCKFEVDCTISWTVITDESTSVPKTDHSIHINKANYQSNELATIRRDCHVSQFHVGGDADEMATFVRRWGEHKVRGFWDWGVVLFCILRARFMLQIAEPHCSISFCIRLNSRGI
jgi:hypothetical protein